MRNDAYRFTHGDTSGIEHWESIKAKNIKKLIKARAKGSNSYFDGVFKIRNRQAKILDRIASIRPTLDK